MRYLIVLERTGTGFSAYSPDLPGCVATGGTREEAEREMAEAIRIALSRAEVMRRVWAQVSAPEAEAQVRLFFQVCGQALQGGPDHAVLFEGIISDWPEPMVAIELERGTPPALARAEVRVGVALMRGLLLDLLATGDRRGVDDAFERFLATSMA